MASATLMKRLAKSVSRMGSGPLLAAGLEVTSVLKSIVAVAVVVPLVSLALDVGGLEHLNHQAATDLPEWPECVPCELPETRPESSNYLHFFMRSGINGSERSDVLI